MTSTYLCLFLVCEADMGFPGANIGETITIDCGDLPGGDSFGTATRYCNDFSRWSDPDTYNCTRIGMFFKYYSPKFERRNFFVHKVLSVFVLFQNLKNGRIGHHVRLLVEIVTNSEVGFVQHLGPINLALIYLKILQQLKQLYVLLQITPVVRILFFFMQALFLLYKKKENFKEIEKVILVQTKFFKLYSTEGHIHVIKKYFIFYLSVSRNI